MQYTGKRLVGVEGLIRAWTEWTGMAAEDSDCCDWALIMLEACWKPPGRTPSSKSEIPPCISA